MSAGTHLTIRGKKLHLEGTNHTDEVKKLWESKGINDNVDVLLLFLWVLNEELCMVTMHLKCLSVDLTHGTNSQNKQLNMVAFKDGNNNVFPGAHAFQPNARQVMFSLFLEKDSQLCGQKLSLNKIVSLSLMVTFTCALR